MVKFGLVSPTHATINLSAPVNPTLPASILANSPRGRNNLTDPNLGGLRNSCPNISPRSRVQLATVGRRSPRSRRTTVINNSVPDLALNEKNNHSPSKDVR